MILNIALALLNTRIWLIFLLFTQGAMYTIIRCVIEKKTNPKTNKKHADWNQMRAFLKV